MKLSEYIGQHAIKRKLELLIGVAKRRSQPLPHILLCGRSGMGKRLLAEAITSESHVNCKRVNAAVIDRPQDIAALLTNLEEGDVLLISDIELLKRQVLEVLTQAVDDFQIGITVGQGVSARSILLDLKKFTLIGTTSKPSQVDNDLRRAAITYEFTPYSVNEIAEILVSLVEEYGIEIEANAAKLLATPCNGCPGNAEVLVKRIVSHFDTVHINDLLAVEALELFGYVASGNNSADGLAGKIRAMTSLEFEEFVASVFQKMGYVVEFTPGSGDHGIDLLIRKDDRLLAVQCKRWETPIGEPVVREFFGSLMGAGASSGYIVASTTFTTHAFAFAENKPIQLIDLDALIGLAIPTV